MFVFAALIGVFTFHACTHMVAAGDTWVAMACGRHFVNHGVDTVEPFSANSHEAGPTLDDIENWPGWARTLAKPFDLETIQRWHPTGWINQNWLTHTMFYWLSTTIGSEDEPNYNALVYWKYGLYALNALAVFFLARVIGASIPSASAAAAFAMLVGRTFLDIRPAGFANLLVPVFLLALALSVYRNIKYIWLIIPVTVLWANCHGGYIYIFIMLVPFTALHLLSILPKRWTLGICVTLIWLILYVIVHKFMGDDMYRVIQEYANRKEYIPVSMGKDPMLWLIVIVSAIGFTIVKFTKQTPGKAYIFYVAMTVFLVLTKSF